MKIFYTFMISLLLTSLLYGQDCANQVNIYFFNYNGVSYEIVKENQTWTNAAGCAVERGGFLAEIDSQEEQDSVFWHLNNAGIEVSNTVAPDGGGASYVWLGGNDLAVEGEWIWDGDNDGTGPQFWQGDYNGNPVGGLYNNWGGEPDNWNNQDGLGLALTSWPFGDPGQWNDVDDQNTLYYVIEYSTLIGISTLDRIEHKIDVYPNPTSDYLTIAGSTETAELVNLSIFDGNGKKIIARNGENLPTTLDISALPAGIYNLVLEDRNGINITKRILVK